MLIDTSFTIMASIENCSKWIYTPDEFKVLLNGSVLLFDELLKNGTYILHSDNLQMCIPDDDDDNSSKNLTELEKHFNSAQYLTSLYIDKIGTIISVIALLLHLAIFSLTSSLQSLPGYNLLSLSLAFLLAYFFHLIEQIPEVLGASCIASSVLEHYFFLAAFFWMNVMAFDVWRSLRQAVRKLTMGSSSKKKKKIILYSSYAWGIPLFIAGTAIVLDNVEIVPDVFKPFFGANNICWFTNQNANMIFFMIPVFAVLVINGIFFAMSAYMMVKNTMTDTSCQHGEIRQNFMVYARLGVLTGLTWLVGIAGILFKRQEIWLIFDIVNSLQGLFVFLLFSSSKKVWNQMGLKMFPKVSKKCKRSLSLMSKTDVL